MEELIVQWDETKNRTNQKKHGIAFEVAQLVFEDDQALLFDDPDHSLEEERFLIVGLAGHNGLCVVSHCYRDEGNIIRIISARKATKREKKSYLEGL